MHSYVTSKNVKWCHLIWPTLYVLSPVRLSVTRTGGSVEKQLKLGL